MPPPRKPGMTANPVRPARHRPGKVIQEESSSSEDEPENEEQEADDDEHNEQQPKKPATTTTTAPKATSFPSKASKITTDLSNVDLNERRKRAEAAEKKRVEDEAAQRKKAADDDEFETEESGSGSEGGSDEESGSSSDEEDSSSEDERTKALRRFRPVYIKKDEAVKMGAWKTSVEGRAAAAEQRRVEEEARRKKELDQIIQENYEREKAEREEGRREWDAEELADSEDVDDTDDLDPEGELAAWKLRELKRVKREREALIAAEKEREEVERRRNLTVEERDAEDKEFLDKQKEERDSRGQASFMQKYHHKGAFYQDEAAELGLKDRNLMGAQFEDQVKNRELLPEYMQIRDMTRLGRKGRQKHKDLKSEDTGRWGESKGGWVAGRRVEDNGNNRSWDRPRDDRYGDSRDRNGPTGANSAPVGDRKRPADGYGSRYKPRSRSRSREGKRARLD